MFNQNVHKMFDYRKTQELTCMIFLCILFAGCNDKKTSGEGNLSNEGLTEVYIDMDNDEDALPFDSLFELASVVKLETTDDNLVGDIFDILPLRDKIVVEDMEISQSVTVYDMNGKYLNRIGTFGQGPEEYSFLEYVSADSTAGIVRISDIGGQKVMSFDENGKFLNSIPMPFFAYRCEPLTDDVVVSHLDEGIALDGKPRLVISDLQKNVRYSGFPTDLHGDYNLVSLHALRRYGDNVFFVPAYREQDTIYQVTEQGLLPERRFDFGSLRWDRKDRFDPEKDKGVYPVDVFENEHSVFLRFVLNLYHREKWEAYNAVYNKETGEVKVSPFEKGITDDVSHFMPLQPTSQSASGEWAQIIQAEKVVDWFEEQDDISNLPEEIQALKQTDADDNPIVAIME